MEHAFRKRQRVALSFTLPSRAVQDSKEECDVNAIMARFHKTGLLKHREQQLVYGDFTKVTSYHEAMNVVANANSMFASLPSSIREKFENDPHKFLAFAEDEKNKDKMIEMGLVKPPPSVDPDIPGEKVAAQEHPPNPESPK